MPNFKNILGQRFSRLVVIECVGKPTRRTYSWKCQCDCGNQTIVIVAKLLNGHTKSCGCILTDLRAAGGGNKKHGLKRTPEYNTWSAMKDRCYNPNNNHYKNYGARGIIICDKWKYDFMAFLSDMGKRPGKFYSIERRDVNGAYEPSNCFWIENRLQGRNKTDNHHITLRGETKLMIEWCEKYDVPAAKVCGRLKRGWQIDDRLFTNFPKGYRYQK